MKQILNTNVYPTSYTLATKKVFDWASSDESRYVCIANVHLIMEAHDSPEYNLIINSADLVTPDGMPLVWLMRLQGIDNQERVYGPTLFLHVLKMAEENRISVGFYGSSPSVLSALLDNIKIRFPNLSVGYSYCPPYRELSIEEEDEIIKNIIASHIKILFVGLGCPKQEIWMAKHYKKLNVVMLGIGAAFDFHAGTKPQAPYWMQKIGMEWFYRLLTEPHRLWKRYLYHNPRFIYFALIDLIRYWSKRKIEINN